MDAGSVLAESLGLSNYTTKTDSIADVGFVDMGYHYPWRVEVGIEEDYTEMKAQNAVMLQSYPNPFSSEVAISYELPWTTKVTVAIYDVNGRLVKTLVDGTHEARYYKRNWQGDDSYGKRLPSGVYFISIVSEKFKSTKKVVLMR